MPANDTPPTADRQESLPPRLDDETVAGRLAQLQGWTRVGDTLSKEYSFPGLQAALDFVDAVAARAEAHDHHPDILLRQEHVTLTLTTHDAGGLTERDFELAAAIDA